MGEPAAVSVRECRHDRLQQGFLAFLYLGRLMKHPQGFSANDAFRFDGQSALKTDELYFDGNSQGAILGGALTAVAQDFTRSVLGEAGMNYSVLLDRSVDFDEYLNLVLRPNYPRPLRSHHRHHAGPVAVGSRRDQRLRQPRHGGPVTRHAGARRAAARRGRRPSGDRVQPAGRGRHARRRRATCPIAAPGRGRRRAIRVRSSRRSSSTRGGGSAYFLWDTGSPSSPRRQPPPREGHDPHDDTPNIPAVRELKDTFWHPDGAVEDVCGGGPCTGPQF